eukprot:SAG31_NODE_4625_length_3087_cov_8.343039_2_plen_125_part_00
MQTAITIGIADRKALSIPRIQRSVVGKHRAMNASSHRGPNADGVGSVGGGAQRLLGVATRRCLLWWPEWEGRGPLNPEDSAKNGATAPSQAWGGAVAPWWRLTSVGVPGSCTYRIGPVLYRSVL